MTIHTITHTKSGASVGVHEFGATVVRFVPSGGDNDDNQNVLFVSSDAKLDGTKAIRGGVPLVFPIFGPSTSDDDMPQHGFLRNNKWMLHDKYDNDESAGITFCLRSRDKEITNGRGKGTWQLPPPADDGKAEESTFYYSCEAMLTIDVSGKELKQTLEITNKSSTDDRSFPFQTLFHTYYHVHNQDAFDPEQCFVKGLQGYTLVDQLMTNDEVVAQKEETVVLDNETDRIFHPTEGTNDLSVTIGVGASKSIKLLTSGEIVNTKQSLPISCVVWNPHIEKAKGMSDFTNEQYKDMICVEPGILLSAPRVPKLLQNQTVRFVQRIIV